MVFPRSRSLWKALDLLEEGLQILNIIQIYNLAILHLLLQDLHTDPAPDLPVRQVEVVAHPIRMVLAHAESILLLLDHLLLIYHLV